MERRIWQDDILPLFSVGIYMRERETNETSLLEVRLFGGLHVSYDAKHIGKFESPEIARNLRPTFSCTGRDPSAGTFSPACTGRSKTPIALEETCARRSTACEGTYRNKPVEPGTRWPRTMAASASTRLPMSGSMSRLSRHRSRKAIPITDTRIPPPWLPQPSSTRGTSWRVFM